MNEAMKAILFYKITETDLFNPRFSWAKVIQANYNTDNIREIYKFFMDKVRKCQKGYAKLNDTSSDPIGDINIYLYNIVADLKEIYPKDFPMEGVLGYYSKELLEEVIRSNAMDEDTLQDFMLYYKNFVKRIRQKIRAEDRIQAIKDDKLLKRNQRRFLLSDIIKENFIGVEFTYQEVKVFDRKVTAIELAELLCDELEIRKLGSKRVFRLKESGKEGI